MLKFLLFLIFCASFIKISAQTFSIEGVVADSALHALQNAEVKLLNAIDSSVVQVQQTNAKGEFSLKNVVVQKDYIVTVSFLGYIDFAQTIFKQDIAHLTALQIQMTPSSTLLQQTEIVAQKDPITIKGDTTEYKASSFKTPPGSTADELLKRLPGVEVNKDGSVNAHGEQVTQIYVNGKKFFGKDPKIATQNLPADAIESVQIFDEKSDQTKFSGMDDGVRDKTINIRLKEKYSQGTFGSVTGGYGTEDRYDAKGTLNKFSKTDQLALLGMANDVNKQNFTSEDLNTYTGSGGNGGNGGRGGAAAATGATPGFTTTLAGGVNYNNTANPKTEINTNYFYNHFDKEIDKTTDRQIFSPIGNYSTHATSASHNINDNNRGQLIIDHKIDSFNSLKFTSAFSYTSNNSTSASNTGTFDASDTLQNFVGRNANTKGHGYTNSNTLLFRHRFSQKAQTFSISLNFSPNNNVTDAVTNSTRQLFGRTADTRRGVDTTLQTDNRDNQRNAYSGNISYTQPLTEHTVLETILTYQLTDNNADRTVYRTFNHESKLDSALSNIFNNTFTHRRGGFNYRIIYDKWQLTTGVLYEQSLINSISSTIGNLDRAYYNFLPSARFRYTFAQGENLTGDYDTNLNEPSVTQLQPIRDISDPANIQVGNPDLKPEYQHQLRMRYNKFDKKSFTSFFINVNARYTTNKIQSAQFIDSSYISTFKPVNVANDISVNTYVGFGIPIIQQKLRCNLSLNMGYNRGINPINNIENIANRYNVGGNMRWDVRLRDTFDFGVQTRVTYNNSDYFSAQTKSSRTYWVHDYDVSAGYTLPFNFRISSDFAYLFYVGDQFNNIAPIPIWNASLSRYFWSDRRGELKLAVFDLLNKNVGFSRTADVTYIQDDRTRSLGRYALLSFTYLLNPALQKAKSSGGNNNGGGRKGGNGGGRDKNN